MLIILAILFFHFLPLELQEAVQLRGCVFSGISTLAIFLLHEQTLQTLCEQAVVSFKTVSVFSRIIG